MEKQHTKVNLFCSNKILNEHTMKMVNKGEHIGDTHRCAAVVYHLWNLIRLWDSCDGFLQQIGQTINNSAAFKLKNKKKFLFFTWIKVISFWQWLKSGVKRLKHLSRPIPMEKWGEKKIFGEKKMAETRREEEKTQIPLRSTRMKKKTKGRLARFVEEKGIT